MTKSLSAALLLALSLPAPLLSQGRVAGPQEHSLPTRVEQSVSLIEAPSFRANTGATVGLVAGGVIGAAFGTFVGMADCSFNDDDQSNCTLEMPMWGLLGAAVVGGLGWLVGRVVGG